MEAVRLDVTGEEALYRGLRRYWHPVMFADELGDEPRPATLLDEAIVVVRMGGGVSAFRDLCVHRGTALSLGKLVEGQLRCAYHGWTYDADGVCTRIPARHGGVIPSRARLHRYRAEERCGLVWVCLDEPELPVPTYAEHDDPSSRVVKIPTYDWSCGAARRIENFVDFSHFPFVHEGILGTPDRPEVPDHEVVRDETTLRFELGVEEVPNPVKGDDLRTGSVRREPSLYVVAMPFTVYLNQPLPDGRHFVLFMASCPVGRRRTRSFSFCARNYDLDPARDGEFVSFQEVILEQDRVVVESQRPEELPVDLSAELHIRGVDRVSIEYRKWLGEIAAAELARGPRVSPG